MGMAREDATGATIEVVVRFAGDLYEVVRVSAGSRYTIGTETVIAKAGTEVQHRLVTVTMTAAGSSRRLPHRLPDARPYVFAGASLLAHLALVITALFTVNEPAPAPIVEPVSQQRGGVRIKTFADDARTVTPAEQPAAAVSPTTETEQIQRDRPAPAEVREFAPSEITGGGLTEGPQDGAGTSERFDPSRDAAFDTIKVGDYSTVSTGEGAGDHYRPQARSSNLVVITCDRMTCLVVGGQKAARIRRAIEERMTELTGCYKDAAENGGGSVEIDFGVDARGAINDLAVGDGDPAGRCVAAILRTLEVDELIAG